MEGQDLATTVLTCEGDIRDPTFPFKLQHLVCKLRSLISNDEKPFRVTKVEPWNSVRVTFNIPQEAAQRLRQLAERGDRVLRELGILSVQIEGDQVITLTLAGRYNEPQEIILRKTPDGHSNLATVSFDLPGSETSPGPSNVEATRKNIAQYLSQHGGRPGTSSTTVEVASSGQVTTVRTEMGFRSPNVVAPTSSEPIPFLAAAASGASSSRLSHSNPSRTQAGFGPFPFASMTHAMNTKHSATHFQPVLHVQGSSSRFPFSTASHQFTTTAGRSSTTSPSTTAMTSNATFTLSSPSATSPQVSVSPALQKVQCAATNSVFNNLVSRVTTPNTVTSTSRANVALSSPLLVNLLQSESSGAQHKLMPPPAPALNQPPKRKRKPRKPKVKTADETTSLGSPPFSTSPSPPAMPSSTGLWSSTGFDPLGVLNIPNISLSPPVTQTAALSSQPQGQPPVPTIHPQAQGQPPVPTIHPQVRGQPSVPIHPQVQGQPPVSSISPQAHGQPPVPNIHPQAQGQPQVHTGNLPLHTRIPVGAPSMTRPPTTLQSLNVSRTVSSNTSNLLYSSVRESSSPKEANKTSPTSTVPDNNPFPSPPPSTDGKTKHLINPFTGQLEPMPSDDEEEDESIGSLPPFPDFEVDTSENGQSERSLSDGGKDNTPSSDTDSGISKSHTDISQSSTDWGSSEQVKESCKVDMKGSKDESKIETVSATASVRTGPGEKLKLRLKLDPKTLRDSKESETREKRNKSESSVPLSHRIDVAVVSIPNVKKGSITGTLPVASEPRVPPLHISLRGPNAAVVVSPRKDDMKSRSYGCTKDNHDTPSESLKYSQKKVRSPRSTKSSELSIMCTSQSLRICESSYKKIKGDSTWEGKKGKEEFWSQNAKSLTGGGIVEMTEKVSLAPISGCDTFLGNTTVASSVRNPCVTLPVTTISTKPEPVSASQEDRRTSTVSLSSIVTCHQPCIPTSSHVISSPLVAFHHATESQTLTCSTSAGTSTLTSLPLCVNSTGVGRNLERTGHFASRNDENVIVRVSTPSTQQKQSLLLAQKDSFSKGDSKLLQNMQGNHHLPQSHKSEVIVDQSGVHDNTVVHRTIPSDCKSTHSLAIPVSCAAAACTVDSHESLCVLGQHSNTADSSSEQVKHKCSSCSSADLKHQTTDHARNASCDSSQSLGLSEKQQNDSANFVTHDTLRKTDDQCNTSLNENVHSVAKHLSQDDIKPIVQNTCLVSLPSESRICQIQTAEQNQHQVSLSITDEPVKNSVDSMSSLENKDIHLNESDKTSSKSSVSSSTTTKHINHSENSLCEPVVVSNHYDCHQLAVSNCDQKQEIEVEDRESDQSSDGLYMMGVKRKSSVAKIITVDTLPLQPHVIEVPSLHTSSAVPKTLAKTRLALEVSTIPSLIPSHGSAFPVRNLVTVHQSTSDDLVMEGRTFSRIHSSRPVTVSHSSGLQNVSKTPFLSNCDSSHINHSHTPKQESFGDQVESMAKEEHSSTSVPSEESSLDSLDEESATLNTSSGNSLVQLHSSSEQGENLKDDGGRSGGREGGTDSCGSEALKDISNCMSSDISPPCRSEEEEKERRTEPIIRNKDVSEIVKKKADMQDIDANTEVPNKEIPSTGKQHPPQEDKEDKEGAITGSLLQNENTCVDVTTVSNEVFSLSKNETGEKPKDHTDSSTNISISSQIELESTLPGMAVSKSLQQNDEMGIHSNNITNEIKQSDCHSSDPFINSDKLDLSGDNTATASSKAENFNVKPEGECTLTSEQKLSENTEEQVKHETAGNVGEQVPNIGTTVTSSVVTSLLSSSRCLTSDAPTGSRVTLIFKGSLNSSSATSHSVLSTANSPTSVVVPINPSKTVPIKLVTLPGGASGLSVRSTSNPAVMEIIGSTSSSSHSSPSSSSPHSPSSVRLVVSKVSPVKTNVPTTAQSGTSTVRNRVVVKSVVVTGTSPSFKIVSAKGAICTTSPVPSTTTTVISTSPTTESPSYHPSSGSVQTVNFQTAKCTTIQTAELQEEQIPSDSVNKSKSSNTECKSLLDASTPNSNITELTTAEAKSNELKGKEVMKESCSDSVTVPSNNQETPFSDNHQQSIKSSPDSSISGCTSVDTTHLDSTTTVLNTVNKEDPALSNNNETIKFGIKPECTCTEGEEIGNISQQPEYPSAKASDLPENLSESQDIENHSEDGTDTASSLEETPCQISTAHPFPSNEEEEEKNTSDLTTDLPSIRPFPQTNVESEETLDESEQTEVEVTDEDKGNDQSEESQLGITLVYSKPLKRKCSENAAELIKACMGVDDNPKRLSGTKQRTGEEIVEKDRIADEDKAEGDQSRMSLRVRRDDTNKKAAIQNAGGSDCSSEEEMSLSELANKSRARGREEIMRTKGGRPSSREAVKEGDNINCRTGGRRSGSNESRKSDESKNRSTYRDGRKEIKDEIKKGVDRTKKGQNKGQDRRSPTRSGIQRGNRGREQDTRNNSLSGVEELIDIAVGKRKTRGSGSSDVQEPAPAKRRRYSKDGHR